MSTNATDSGWRVIDRLAASMAAIRCPAGPALVRRQGWSVSEYDGSRPCLPTPAIRAIAERLAKKKGEA